MRTQVKKAVCAGQETMEYALLGRRRTESSGPQEPGRERLKELLLPMVREAVQKQLKEQQDYYRSRPSLALRQAEQIFGAGNVERAIAPAVSRQVYEQLEERICRERLRKGR
ncbi:hypothetical protein IMSAG185_01045 [Lachnospiraceae bacterium]|jgi:hypothetical protein|nr:hypothetical protein [Lachnospiraceae bacterium]GFI65446.1 hypothetical protein IMSAG185_01045 [Lachnospiraceae bacterium]